MRKCGHFLCRRQFVFRNYTCHCWLNLTRASNSSAGSDRRGLHLELVSLRLHLQTMHIFPLQIQLMSVRATNKIRNTMQFKGLYFYGPIASEQFYFCLHRACYDAKKVTLAVSKLVT